MNVKMTNHLVPYPATDLKVLPAGTIIKTISIAKPVEEASIGGLFTNAVNNTEVAPPKDKIRITSEATLVKKLKENEVPYILCLCNKRQKYKEGTWVVCLSRNKVVKLGEQLPSGTGFLADAPIIFVNNEDITEVIKSNYPFEGVAEIDGEGFKKYLDIHK